MTSQIIYSFSAPASADLSAKQFRLVVINNAGQIAVAGDGVAACGVLLNNPDAALKACTVGASGIAKVVSGGAITAGDPVAADLNGAAIKALTGKSAVGIALDSAVAADLVRVLLTLGPGQVI